MTKCETAMRNSVVDTLEQMAFLEISTGENSSAPATVKDGRTVSLLIHDPVQGELRLCMSKPLLVRITEILYNISENEITDQMLNDNLAEIINIIAGRFMNEMVDDGQAFRLGLPELDPEDLFESGLESREWVFTSDSDEFTVVAIGKDLLGR